VRLKPVYLIFGEIGCEPELIEVCQDKIIIDTTYESCNRQSNILLYDLKGNCYKESDSSAFNVYKIKIPLIMLFDYRNHFGGPNSFGRYGYIEFKLFGIIRQYTFDKEQDIPIYFPDLYRKMNSRKESIGKLFGKGCFKNKRFIDCD